MQINDFFSSHMQIIPAGKEDWSIIRDLAYTIWPVAYQNVIPQEQIDYMLNRGYSTQALEEQAEEGHQFFILWIENEPVGFFAWQSLSSDKAKLQKLYVLPSCHGKGLGQKLLETAKDYAKSTGHLWLILNVNRGNPSVAFYEKMGGRRLETLDIPYGPYVLEDYIYGWELT